MSAPDSIALGWLDASPDALRYGSSEDFTPREVVSIMHELMPSGVRVLDVGCGTGGSAIAVNRGKANELVCIEPDQERWSVAVARGLDARCGLFDGACAQELGKFDVIVLADVLEHQSDPTEMLAIAQACLRPGGCVIASAPNVAHWSIRLKLLLGRFDYTDTGIMDATHLRWFTRKTFVDLFRRSGFQVEAVRESTGAWMTAYNSAPFKLVPGGIKNRMLWLLLSLFPRLFACQYVVQARVRGAS